MSGSSRSPPRLDYVASPTATSLASGRTQVVGVVAPFLTRWFFATLVSAIEKTLRRHGHHVLLFDLEDESYDRRLPLSQNMLWKRVDGVITLNLPMTDDGSSVRRPAWPAARRDRHPGRRPSQRPHR